MSLIGTEEKVISVMSGMVKPKRCHMKELFFLIPSKLSQCHDEVEDFGRG